MRGYRRTMAWCIAAAMAGCLVPQTAEAQGGSLESSGRAAADGQPQDAGAQEPGAASRFLSDVGTDYRHFFSTDTAVWLGVGGGLSLAIHQADEAIRDATQGPSTLTTTLEGGQWYGGAAVQVPLAVAWWTIGHASGSARGAEAGRDLVRAQINAASWTFVLKLAVDRTRPNGDPRSFPSGHASSTFATAMVLEDHYGWKLGLPAFAAATYTAASRLTDNKHWASDVVFGAFLGMASARTVTMHMRTTKLTVSPIAVDGGGGVLFRVARPGS